MRLVLVYILYSLTKSKKLMITGHFSLLSCR